MLIFNYIVICYGILYCCYKFASYHTLSQLFKYIFIVIMIFMNIITNLIIIILKLIIYYYYYYYYYCYYYYYNATNNNTNPYVTILLLLGESISESKVIVNSQYLYFRWSMLSMQYSSSFGWSNCSVCTVPVTRFCIWWRLDISVCGGLSPGLL